MHSQSPGFSSRNRSKNNNCGEIKLKLPLNIFFCLNKVTALWLQFSYRKRHCRLLITWRFLTYVMHNSLGKSVSLTSLLGIIGRKIHRNKNFIRNFMVTF